MLMDMHRLVYLVDHKRKVAIVCRQSEARIAAQAQHERELGPDTLEVLIDRYPVKEGHAAEIVFGVTDDGGVTYSGVYAMHEQERGRAVVAGWRRGGAVYSAVNYGRSKRAEATES